MEYIDDNGKKAEPLSDGVMKALDTMYNAGKETILKNTDFLLKYGVAKAMRGEYDEAYRIFNEALETAKLNNDKDTMTICVENLVAIMIGKPVKGEENGT